MWRTAAAGINPAVNMDTGYVNLLDATFVVGVFIGDQWGDGWSRDAYRNQMDLIHEFGGTPVIFQSYSLTAQERALRLPFTPAL